AVARAEDGLPAVAAPADTHLAQEPPGSGTNLCTACEDGSAWIPLRPALAGPLQLAQQVEFPVMLFAQLGLHVPAPVPTRRQLHQARRVPRQHREIGWDRVQEEHTRQVPQYALAPQGNGGADGTTPPVRAEREPAVELVVPKEGHGLKPLGSSIQADEARVAAGVGGGLQLQLPPPVAAPGFQTGSQEVKRCLASDVVSDARDPAQAGGGGLRPDVGRPEQEG